MVLLSIIIPTFNSSLILSRAIESILCQDFKDYEIWVIDGRSTDNTVEIIREYQSGNKKIHFISEPDKGIYDAMNKGIEATNGQWLYFMGSDDTLYDSHVLTAIFGAEKKIDCDVLYGNVYSAHFNGIYDGEFTPEKLYNKNICHQAIFMRRNIFQTTGNFDIRYRAHADWDHNIKWFLNPGIKKKHIDIIVAEYAEGGFSSLNDDQQFVDNKNEVFLKYGGARIDKNFRTLLLQSRASQMKNKNNFVGYLKYKLKSYLSRYA
jgi:glycosyltransferase involved in cell wall biosynthesis